MFRQIGPLEITLILLLVVLLFGAKKLPETARGLGRSLKIFKAETKGLRDDDAPAEPTPGVAPRAVEERPASEPVSEPAARPVADADRRDA